MRKGVNIAGAIGTAPENDLLAAAEIMNEIVAKTANSWRYRVEMRTSP
jgi:hypothetical protein